MIRRELRTKTEKAMVIVGASCDGCDKELSFVFPDLLNDQFEHSIAVHLCSGYGESQYLDGTASTRLCDECLEKLFALFPKIKAVVEESGV